MLEAILALRTWPAFTLRASELILNHTVPCKGLTLGTSSVSFSYHFKIYPQKGGVSGTQRAIWRGRCSKCGAYCTYQWSWLNLSLYKTWMLKTHTWALLSSPNPLILKNKWFVRTTGCERRSKWEPPPPVATCVYLPNCQVSFISTPSDSKSF